MKGLFCCMVSEIHSPLLGEREITDLVHGGGIMWDGKGQRTTFGPQVDIAYKGLLLVTCSHQPGDS